MRPDVLKQVTLTPAFVIDRRQILDNMAPLLDLRKATGCRILYSMKALAFSDVLTWLKPLVDGFSVSSLFEAKLAHEILNGEGSLHLTTPGLRAHEFDEISSLCSHVSFNSLSQFEGLHAPGFSSGLRVNTKCSFVDDERYNPCRLHSKLGVDIELLRDRLPDGVDGLQFHTVFGRTDFEPLQRNLQALAPVLTTNAQLRWLNFGGGYLYNAIGDYETPIELINDTKRRYELEIYVEPGNAVVGNAGYLVTRVIDRFVSDGQTVLILDTSVNHLPEVFEYQRQPSLHGDNENGGHRVLLAGSTCLAGDLLGEYRFATIPQVGDKLIFKEVGAYSMVKAHRFNGYDLPAVYSIDGYELTLLKRYGYEAYRAQWACDDASPAQSVESAS